MRVVSGKSSTEQKAKLKSPARTRRTNNDDAAGRTRKLCGSAVAISLLDMPEGVRSRHQARQRDGRTENQSWNAHSGPTRGRATFRNRVCSAHNIVVVALIGFLFVICLSLVAHFDGVLPAPRGLDTPLQEYSEARARAHLNTIVDFGVRTVGSKSNEVDTVKFLLDEVSKLQQEADEVQQKADDSSHDNPLKVLVDVHRPSGAFSSDFLEGFTNVYHNVTNVVVLIEGTAPAAEQRSVLVNAHFDTALGTPAASDDAVMIASMLEIARNVIHGPRLRHSVIFNFNGAEETNWMAVRTSFFLFFLQLGYSMPCCGVGVCCTHKFTPSFSKVDTEPHQLKRRAL